MTRIIRSEPPAEPTVRRRIAPGRRAQHRDRGFTLVELLVVVSILGVLTTVSTVSVRGLSSNAQAGACEADRRTLEIAVESALANDLSTDQIPLSHDGDTFASAEEYLVATGYLRAVSDLHDVSTAGAITATAGGACAVAP